MLKFVSEVTVSAPHLIAVSNEIARRIDAAADVPGFVLRDYRAFLSRPVDFFLFEAAVAGGSVSVTAQPDARLRRLLSFSGGVK